MSRSITKLTDEQREFYKLMVIRATDNTKGQPYIAHMFHRLIPVNAPGLGTFGVDEWCFLYIDFDKFMAYHGENSDPKTLQKNVVEATSWLAHEPWHVLRDHHRRFKDLPQPYNHTAANLAGDLELDDDIKRFVTAVAVMPGVGDFVKYAEGDYMENYYKQLLQDDETMSKFQRPQPQNGGGQGQQGQPGQGGGKPGQGQGGQGNQPGQGQSGQGGQPGQGGGQPGQPGNGQGGQSGQGQGQGGGQGGGDEQGQGSKRTVGCSDLGEWKLDEAERAEAGGGLDEEEVNATRRRVAEDIKKHERSHPGTIQGSLKDWAGEVLAYAPVSWRQMLRAQIKQGVQVARGRLDYSMRRPNRRQPTEFLRPGMVAPKPKILVGCDTSGSNLENLGVVVEEVVNLSQQMGVRGRDLQFFAVDVDVHKVRPTPNPREVLNDVRLGGGTRMRPAYELAAAQRGPDAPGIFILMTDAEVAADDFPDERPAGNSDMLYVTVVLHNERWGQNVLEQAEARLSSWSKVIPILVGEGAI